ncbi:MAG: tetratricopeptide repeat protein [Opitutae bacterium]|nr:tetratricopeptide repeat protein [Opitutae bacterium]
MLRPFALCATALLLTVSTLAATEDSDRAEIKRLIDGRHWAAAQPLLEKAIAAQPQDAEAHYLLGLSLINQNKGDTAVAPLEKATALAPTNSEYQRALGDAYGVSAQKSGLFSKLGWARKCKAAYEKAVELDPKNIFARASVMQFCLQAPSIVGGGIDKAYAQAEEIKKLDPAQGRAAYATLYLAEKKYAEAFALLDDVLKDTPNDYEALYQVGRLAAITGEHLDRGLATLRQCLTLTPPQGQPPHAAVHWRIGNILEKQGDKTAAKTAYEASLRVDPNFKNAIEALKKLG